MPVTHSKNSCSNGYRFWRNLLFLIHQSRVTTHILFRDIYETRYWQKFTRLDIYVTDRHALWQITCSTQDDILNHRKIKTEERNFFLIILSYAKIKIYILFKRRWLKTNIYIYELLLVSSISHYFSFIIYLP